MPLPMAITLPQSPTPVLLLPNWTTTTATSPLKPVGNANGSRLVRCPDSPLDEHIDSLPTLLSYLQSLQKVAPLTSSVMFEDHLSCAGWKSHGWRYEGLWRRETHNPILFIGNTYDNITPLSSAVHNAGHFADSSVLVQDSYGHCSTSTPSVCTAGVRRRYFPECLRAGRFD
jgi:hypothetical protein